MKKTALFVFLYISGSVLGMESDNSASKSLTKTEWKEFKKIGVPEIFQYSDNTIRTKKDWQDYEKVKFVNKFKKDPALFFVNNLEEENKTLSRILGYRKQNFMNHWIQSNQMFSRDYSETNGSNVEFVIEESPITQFMTCNDNEIKEGYNYVLKKREQEGWKKKHKNYSKVTEYANKWYIKYPAIIAGAFGLGYLFNSDSDFVSKITRK